MRTALMTLFCLVFVPAVHAGHTSGSTTDANGNTVSYTKNADGTTTKTLTSPNGQQLDSETVQPEPVTKTAPREKGTSGSTTDADGNTVTYKKNADGSTTKTVTSPDGQVLDAGPVEQPPVTKPKPREGGDSASTTDANGNTVTIKKNPDGSKTQTVTTPDGTVISEAPVEAPPVTKPKPREGGDSASTVDAQGNTITIQTLPDGTKVKIVTGPDGTELDREPVAPLPPTIRGERMVYDEVKKGPVTATVGVVGRRSTDGQQVLLEVSIIALGPKGPSARTWEVDSIVLETPNGKLKPVSSEPFYVAKEGTGPSTIAQAVFAAIGTQYALAAAEAKPAEGEVCPVTGQAMEEKKQGRFSKEVERQGMAGAMALLTSQAKGQVTGRKATFDVTHVPFLKDIPVLGHAFNSRHDARPNPSDPTEVNLVIMVNPTILQAAE